MPGLCEDHVNGAPDFLGGLSVYFGLDHNHDDGLCMH